MSEIKEIVLPPSKSLYQRFLLLYGAQCLSTDKPLPHALIPGAHYPQDCRVMHRCVCALLAGAKEIDTSDNGTALRFLLTMAAMRPEPCVFHLANRRQRPVAETLKALQDLGTHITHSPDNEIIVRGPFTVNSVRITATTTSQHFSALMLIAPSLPNGLEIVINGEPVSQPYIDLTMATLRDLGIDITRKGNTYRIPPARLPDMLSDIIEPDWASAVFAYEAVFTGRYGKCQLHGLSLDSRQPERKAADIFATLGVTSCQTSKGVIISKDGKPHQAPVCIDARLCPDSIPALTVGMSAIGVPFTITSTSYLSSKESDRPEALRQGLALMGKTLAVNNDNITYSPDNDNMAGITRPLTIRTHGDHRIAMAFAALPAALCVNVDNTECVSKSFPDFWQQITARPAGHFAGKNSVDGFRP